MPQLFADIRTPYVNEATLKRHMSSRVKENIFRNIFTRPGEAVTEKFSEDVEAAEIQVIRIKPNDSDAREIGADKNGGWFNSDDAHTSNTEAYSIKILTTIDDLIDVPTNQQDMMNVDVVEGELTNLSGKVHRNVNALTIAAQLCKNFNDIKAAKVDKNWVELDADAPNYLEAIIEAGGNLDDGNPDEGIDAYPDEFRAVYLRSSAKKMLLKKGQLIIGGSNAAQNIIRGGGLDENTSPDVAASGYLGEVDNIPAYLASKSVWTLAEKYLGLAKGTLDGVEMLVVSGIGTGRALAFNSAIQIGDCPRGQGRRIKPKYRMGAECWDALSVVPVVKNGFANPAQNAALTVKATASR